MTLVTSDPITRRRAHIIEHSDGVDLVQTQDISDTLELNKEQFNQRDGTFKGDMVHVGRIPLIIMEQMIRDGVLGPGGAVKDPKRFRDWMNDPDNRAFRTHPGKI